MDLMSIRRGQMMKKIYRLDFFKIIKNYFYALFLTSPVAMATAHSLAKMRE